jgi:FkbM family methyltransferase
MIQKQITYEDKTLTISCHQDLIYNLIESSNTFFEEWLLTPLRSKIKSFDFTVDIGANIGNHAMFFKEICNAKTIVCFEPLPENVKLLKINCPECILYEIALSSTDGIKFLQHTDGINNNSGTAKITGNEGIPVQSAALDSFNFKNVTFIKIDVEGHEVEVIKGSINTISKYKPDLLVELHLGIYPQDILNELPTGYTCEYIGKENHYIFSFNEK